MPEKMKIYNKDGSEAEVDAVDGNRYLSDPVISQEWAAKPWTKAKTKSASDATSGDAGTASTDTTATSTDTTQS